MSLEPSPERPTPAGDPGGVGDPTGRFAGRVEDYVRHRPGYPEAVLDALRGWGYLPADAVVLDVGAGTGISSEPFLRAGHRVFGVEPNAEMRGAAQRGVGSLFPRQFYPVAGRAEATTLGAASVDLVVAGQAFHWFEPVAARAEFTRVLRPGVGAVALLWNERLRDASPFLADYERLLRTFGTDYAAVSDSYPTPAKVAGFFQVSDSHAAEFPNGQTFGFEGLLGRTRSSSYVPAEGSPAFGPMRAELRAVFDRHQRDGEVRFEYRTVVYAAKIL